MPDNEISICPEELAGVKNLEAEFDADTAKELALAFLEDTSTLLAKMEAALEKGDNEVLRASAHMLKGCARALQAKKCEKISSALELFAKEGDLESARETLTVLHEVYSATAEFLRQYIG